MEFKIKEIKDDRLILELYMKDDFYINARVKWIEESLNYFFKNKQVIYDIINTVNSSNMKLGHIDNNTFYDLTEMKAEDRDNLIDQLNSILMMEKLVG